MLLRRCYVIYISMQYNGETRVETLLRFDAHLLATDDSPSGFPNFFFRMEFEFELSTFIVGRFEGEENLL